jgi:hypothetical protein
VPRNSPIGFITAFFAVMLGFAGIWHIWWMAILGLLAAVISDGIRLEREPRGGNPGRRNCANGTRPA